MSEEMSERDREAFDHFIQAYQFQWNLNQYFREGYDNDMDYYIGQGGMKNYPISYKMQFNKLLPRVFTILSRFMDQLYQPATHDFVSVRPRKRRDVERAPRVRGLLNYQMETLNDIDMNGGAYMFHLQWMLSAMSWGKGIAKLYWKKEERVAPRRVQIPFPITNQMGQIVDIGMQDFIIEEPQIVYDGPYAEVRPPKCFVPHPHYRYIQQMPFVFDVYERSLEYLRKMQENGTYRNVDKIQWGEKKGRLRSGAFDGNDSVEAFVRSLGLEGADIPGSFSSDRLAPSVDVIECYGKYIFPEDDTSYEVGSGIKIKGKESDAIAHIGNYKTLLKLEKNKYGVKPYFAIGCYPHPELFWDIGLIRLGKSIQEQANVLANTRFQNATMLVNQMLKVRADADIDPAALIWKPFGLVPVEDMNDVQPLVTIDQSQTGIFREQEEFFESAISDMLGLYPYNLGQTPNRQEHVGTIYSLQSMGEARTKLLMMTMDYQGFQPLLKYMMLLNTWHLPSDFEARITDSGRDDFMPMFPGDVHWDYDFSVRYTAMEPALGKQFRLQQLLQWAGIWAQSPALQQAEIMKASLELLDFHETDRYIKSPEQMAMEQQQAMQGKVQMMQMNAMLQDQMAAKNDERDLVKNVTTALVKR